MARRLRAVAGCRTVELLPVAWAYQLLVLTIVIDAVLLRPLFKGRIGEVLPARPAQLSSA